MDSILPILVHLPTTSHWTHDKLREIGGYQGIQWNLVTIENDANDCNLSIFNEWDGSRSVTCRDRK
jgi:hypothetical protein